MNQFTIIENNNNRRPDIILFINGLPLVVIELKNPADENATIWTAFNQIETYKTQIPSLFHYNEISVISDGIEARAGTITSNKERFMPWKTIEGKEIAPTAMPQLEVLFQGMFDMKILLDLIRLPILLNLLLFGICGSQDLMRQAFIPCMLINPCGAMD